MSGEILTMRLVLETDQAEKQIEATADNAARSWEKVAKANGRAMDGIRAAVGRVQGIGDAIGQANQKLENLGSSAINGAKAALRLVVAFKLIQAAASKAGVAALGGVSLLAQRSPVAEKALVGVGSQIRAIGSYSPRLNAVSSAVDGIAAAAKQGEAGFAKLYATGSLLGRVVPFLQRNKSSLLALGTSALFVATSVAVVVASFEAMSKVAEVAQQRIDLIGSAKIWQVQQQEVDAYRHSLNDVKTGLEALSSVLELRQIGFTESDVSRLATMVNIIAAVTGEAKESVEQRLKGAQVTERDLGVFSKLTGELKTQQGIQNALARAQLRAGGAMLTQAVKSQVISQYLAGSADAAKQLERNLGNVGKANPFTIIRKQIRTVKEDVVTYIAPTLLKAFEKLFHYTKAIGKGFAIIWLRIRHGAKESERILKQMSDATYVQSQRQSKELGKLNKTRQKQEQAGHNKTLDALRQQKAQQEAITEALGRQQRARTLSRNFEREALARIAAWGARGISQTISGISQLVELSKVLGDNFSGSSRSAQLLRLQLQAGSVAAKKLAINEKIQTASLASQLALSQSIRAEVQARAQLSDIEGSLAGGMKSVNAAILVLQRKKSRVAEYGIKQLRQALEMLKKEADRRKQIVRLQLERAKIEDRYSKRKETLDHNKKMVDLLSQQKALTQRLSRINGDTVRDRGESGRRAADNTRQEIAQIQILIQKNQALKKTVLDARSAQKLETQIRDSQNYVNELKKRLSLEQKLIDAQKRSAFLADERARKQLGDSIRASTIRQSDLQSQLRDLQAKNATGLDSINDGGETATQGALRKSRQQIKQLAADLASLNRQLNLVSPNSAQAFAIQQTLAAKEAELGITKKIAHEQARMVEREKERLTVVGSLVQTMQGQVRGLAQRLGRQIAQQITGIAQTMVGTLGQLFTDMVSAPTKAIDNLGKSILSAFGDIALQLAAFFAAEAIGMAFTPGGQAAAVGLGVAAAGLAAIGGSLKGIAAAINPPSAPSTSSTGGSSGAPARQGLPGAQPREREQSNTYYLVTNSIYGSEESQARNLRDFVRRNKRSLGGRMF